MWNYLLGNKNKQLNQESDGTLIVTNKYVPDASNSDVIKTKRPTSLLKISYKENKKIRPSSAGEDGFLYAINLGNKRPLRSEDGFETEEYGYDFFTAGIGEVEFLTKTKTGFLVYINHTDKLTASVWHSTKFDSEYEKVLELDHGYIVGGFIPRPWHEIGQGVVLVSEYSIAKNPTKPCRAWFSKHGGKKDSWILLNTHNQIDLENNAHIHATCYDPWKSRFYVSKGDYNNRKLEFSDDEGLNWQQILTDTQPTLLEAMPNVIASAPDFGDAISINNIVKVDGINADVKPFVEKKLNISDKGAYGNFGKGPVGGLVGSEEMYVTFSESGSGIKKCYVAATGDGGASWHLVHTLEIGNGRGLYRGLVSDPKTGVMYGALNADIMVDGQYNHLAVIEPIQWK